MLEASWRASRLMSSHISGNQLIRCWIKIPFKVPCLGVSLIKKNLLHSAHTLTFQLDKLTLKTVVTMPENLLVCHRLLSKVI